MSTIKKSSVNSGWRFWIDRGGTFTDVIAISPQGEVKRKKLLSEHPERYRDAAVQGIAEFMEVSGNASPAASKIASIRMGTTVATNALLERQGAAVLFVTTEGFGDGLAIGHQTRNDLFDLNIKKSQLLYSEVIEVQERIGAHGEIIYPLNCDVARQQLQNAFEKGYRSCAIALMHAYRYPIHEKQLKNIARDIGFSHISTSHEVSPLIKWLERAGTATVDSSLSPVLHHYVKQFCDSFDDTEQVKEKLFFMQSNGGLCYTSKFHGHNAILSGPAGGVVGMIRTAQYAGFDRLVGFDMGGTSTDVSHFSGEYERNNHTEVDGIAFYAPTLKIRTIAAGGGSILRFADGRYQVGPRSAGALPGPACYGRGGPATLTDCHLVLGRLVPTYFPQVFGQHGNAPIDVQSATKALQKLCDEQETITGNRETPFSMAQGFLQVATANMAEAIKHISVEQGFDPREHVLCCFGGAGGLHACGIAESLDMAKVLIHEDAGVLSALGIGMADFRVVKQHSIENLLDEKLIPELSVYIKQLEKSALEELQESTDSVGEITINVKVSLRYQGSQSSILLPFTSYEELHKHFIDSHRQRFGFVFPERPLVMENVQVEAVIFNESNYYDNHHFSSEASPHPVGETLMMVEQQQQSVPIYHHTQLAVKSIIKGAAIITQPTATIVIEPGWQGEILSQGELLLSKLAVSPSKHRATVVADPVQLEIFHGLFMSVAKQMGYVLQNTAASINIKERQDYSCALFDKEGQLVANAPHIPVHLGSMGEAVRSVIKQQAGRMQPGDIFLHNTPWNGGTHLPDITAVRPLHSKDGKHIHFYTAARGHHADIGGTSPGSMPATSQHIDEEGILFDCFPVVSDGVLNEKALHDRLCNAPWPARNPEQNLADLRAQVASCLKGAQEILNMQDKYGIEVVEAYTRHVQDNAELAVRRALEQVVDGSFTYVDDGGRKLCVKVTVDSKTSSVEFDFSGTSKIDPGNFNAPEAVCRAAVLYVLRTLVDDPIPLNEGCLKPVSIHIPQDCLLSPRYPAAVAAGNVETSQMVVNTLLAALGKSGWSQGTMNNFSWGNDDYQYYETICGGAGATSSADGASAVQTHMTNSRLTDPEILEWHYPVRIEAFYIRKGSGGSGKYRGGDGVCKRIRFLVPMKTNMLSGNRVVAPVGLKGGGPGQVGKNYVEKAKGERVHLAGIAQYNVAKDDVYVIETPGGGGFG